MTPLPRKSPSLFHEDEGEWNNECLDEESGSDDEPSVIITMNLISSKFRDGTSPWDPALDGNVLSSHQQSIAGVSPDSDGSRLNTSQQSNVAGGKTSKQPFKPIGPDTTTPLWDPHKRGERRTA